MSSVNKVILIGRCGRDVEIRVTPSGMSIGSTSIATSSKRKGVEETQWHRVTFFDKLAEIAGEYLTKGKEVYIEGRLSYEKYTDKDGIEREVAKILVDQMQLLGGRGGDEGRDERPMKKPLPENRPSRGDVAKKKPDPFDDDDEMIPF